MIENTIDMQRLNKGDFILANIPVDLPEAIPFSDTHHLSF